MKMMIPFKIKKILFFVLLLSFYQASCSYILIPMNNDQKNHLKAYGIAYKTIANDIYVSWLLNYEGGSFLIKYTTLTSRCKKKLMKFLSI